MQTRIISIAIAIVTATLALSALGAAAEVTLMATPGGGQPMGARVDAKGVIHLVYQSAAGPQYVRSADGGKTFSTPLTVVDSQARKPGLEFSVWDVAVSPAGAVHVALGTNAWKLKLPKEQWAFHYARLEPDAAAFAPVVNINRTPSEGFSLAADAAGNVTACWLSGKLFANVSHDGGKTFSPAVEIDAKLDPCDCCTSSIVYGADGRVAVLYREETNNERDMYLLLWDQKRKQVSRTRVSTTPWEIGDCPMTYYSVTPTASGYLAAWPTRGDVYFARLDAQGKLLEPVEVKTPGTSGMRTGLVILPDAAGNTLVAWKKNGDLGWHVFDQTGQSTNVGGNARSPGSGVAGVLTPSGKWVLFR